MQKHLFFFALLLCFLWSCRPPAPAGVQARLVELRQPREAELIELTPDLSVPAEEPGFTLLLPQDTVRGMIVLFHSGRDTSHAGYEMRLYTEAARRQVATMYVTTGNPFEFLFDTSRFEQLDRYIEQAISDHGIPRDRLLFAGMSLAGTRALKFGLWCREGYSWFGLQPRAIALCDAPLDFFRFWREGDFSIRYNTNPTSVDEARWVNAQLEKHLGGTPGEAPEAYRHYSPYVKSSVPDERLRLLQGVAVRAYTEPDVQWWMENRQKDYYGTNAVDAAAFINELHLLGHTEAELITTSGKGYRPNGQRHPHSWSIVDNAGLVEWLLGL